MNNKFTIPLFLLVIVFFFYLGTTVNDPQSSLINGVLVLSQILSSITTVIAVVIAFKTYKNWLNQITHPELYRDDKAIMDKLNVIHYKCRDFSDCKGFRIEHIFYEYKIIIEEENHDVDSINFLNNEWNETMREQKKQINSLLIRKFQSDILDNSAYIFYDDKDRPKVLYKYKESLDNYIRVANHICSKELHKSRVRFLPYLYYKEDIKVDDLATNGRAFMRLEDSYREVKAYYREKWSYQSLK